MKRKISEILLLTAAVFMTACNAKEMKDQSVGDESSLPAAASTVPTESQAALEPVRDTMEVRPNMNGSASFSYADHIYTLPMPFREMIPLLGKKGKSYTDDSVAFLRTMRKDAYQKMHMQDVDFTAADFSYEPKAEDVFLFTLSEYGSVAYVAGVRNEEDHNVTAAEMTVTDFYISTPFFYDSVLLPGNIDPWIMQDGKMPITTEELMQQWGKPEAIYDFSKVRNQGDGSKIAFRETDTMENFIKTMGLKGTTLDYLVKNEDGTFTGTVLDCHVDKEEDLFSKTGFSHIANMYFFYHGGKWYDAYRKESGHKIAFS